MASATNKDIPDIFQLYSDIFSMHKEFYFPEESKAYWNNAISVAHNIHAKYGTALSKDLCLAVIDELEERYNLIC